MRAAAALVMAAALGCRAPASPPRLDDPRTGLSAQAPAGWSLAPYPETLDRFSEALCKLVVGEAGRPAAEPGSSVRRLARFSSAPVDGLGAEDAVVTIAVIEVGAAPALREDHLLSALVRAYPGGAALEGLPRALSVGGIAGTSVEARFPYKSGEFRHQAFLGRRGGMMLVLGIASRTPEGLAKGGLVLGSLKLSTPGAAPP